MDARSRHSPAPASEAGPVAELETLGQLVGQFAHDINNLLASVLTGVELAAQIEGDARARRLLAGVIETIERQRSFTTAMAQAAHSCENARTLDAHTVIEACSGDLRSVLGAAALELRLDAADARIRCDPRFLRTALRHLALNARAAMAANGRLLLTTRNLKHSDIAGERDFLLLSASDSGEGMPDAVRRRAFETFFSSQADAGGLGLAQVRDTARRSGGSVRLETVPGQGTTIGLLFPLANGTPTL